MSRRRHQEPTPLDHPMFSEPLFAEGVPTPDPNGFLTDHPSDKDVYAQVEQLLKTKVVGFEPLRGEARMTLADAYGARGADVEATIRDAGRLVFHAVGDTGATSDGAAYDHELSVADQLTDDVASTEIANRPAFMLHLGDVVYDFGEAQYYYDEFYAPYRDYPAPIFALAGNHDSFVVPGTPDGETPLDVFRRNFCAEAPAVTAEARSLHRTAMTQPGVYFRLDAPFIRILVLFSNALEDPGVISDEDGRWPAVPDHQIAFLERELKAVKDEGFDGALLVAVHHPPFSYATPPRGHGHGTTGSHGSSTTMLRQIDRLCAKVGIYPHAFISGHAHNYQRYTRTVAMGDGDYDVPFIVCGSGGHHVNRLVRATRGQAGAEPHFGTDVGYLDVKPAVHAKGLLLEKYSDTVYGYLRVSVTKEQLAIGYHQVGVTSLAQSRFDKVTVDLATHTMVSN